MKAKSLNLQEKFMKITENKIREISAIRQNSRSK